MAILLIGCGASSRGAAEPGLFDLTLDAALGDDRGQSLGTLFEARDGNGRVLFGAAFPDAHSTYVRDNNRVLTFYAKTPVSPRIEPLGKLYGPDHNGSRLLVAHDDLLAFFREFNPVQARRLKADGTWAPYEASWKVPADFAGVQFIADRPLVFSPRQVVYDNRPVFTSAEAGCAYYVDGRLFVCQGAAGRLLVGEWNPQSGGPLTEEACRSYPIEGNPFVFGSYRGHVLVATNIGNVYAWRDGRLDQLRRSDGKSWQAYSIIRVGDRLLIGQYPTGSLFAYAGTELKPFEPALPVPPGASPNSREAQTLALYGGDLYAGVWPWGELWRYDCDEHTWHFVARLFDAPPVTDEIIEPFAAEMQGKSDVYNYWGQRIVSLANLDDALYIGTMNKQGMPYKPSEHGFLGEATLAQYGRIHRLTGAAQIARQIAWRGKTRFRFVWDGARLSLYQDGRLLGETPLASERLEGRQVKELKLGDGISGEFPGEIVESDIASGS